MSNHTADSSCHRMSYSGLTFSFLAGGIAGATVALLLAPRTGKATRELMGRKLNDTADSAREFKGRVADKLNETADSAREFKGRVADKLNEAAGSVRELKDRAFRQGQDIREEATDRAQEVVSAFAGKAALK